MSGEELDIRQKLLSGGLSRRAFLGGSLGLFAGALLAACGGDDDDDDDSDEPTGDATEADGGATEADAGEATSAPEEEEATEPAGEEEEEAATEPEEEGGDTTSGDGGVTRVRAVEVRDFENPSAGEPSGDKPDELIMAWGATQFTTHGIDPQLHVGTIAENQLRHMYEPLVQFERDLVTISPCLATEWERIDELTMQFKLREGVTYHNGEEFNAEAVRYSILRPLSDETPGDSRSTYAIIEEVEVVDDLTVNDLTST